MSLLAGALFILLCDLLSALVGQRAGGSSEVLVQAAVFIHIYWLSAPSPLANMVLVLVLVVGNAVNILLDLWLVLGLKWGVAGAATATALAMVWRVLKMCGIILAMLKKSWRGDISRLLRLNRDIMLRSLLGCSSSTLPRSRLSACVWGRRSSRLTPPCC